MAAPIHNGLAAVWEWLYRAARLTGFLATLAAEADRFQRRGWRHQDVEAHDGQQKDAEGEDREHDHDRLGGYCPALYVR